MMKNKVEEKLNHIEKFGEGFGKVFGLIVKSPFRFLAFIFSFTIVALIAFVYSAKKGIEKS